jgi:hypothetical protein
MISNTKTGFGLVAVVAMIAGAIFVFSRFELLGSTQDRSTSKTLPDTAQRSVSKVQSQSGQSSSSNDANTNAKLGSLSEVTPATGATPNNAQLKAQRAQRKIERTKAMDELTKLVAKGGTINPKELNMALSKVEATIDSPEGKKQIAMSRKVYEYSARLQALATEYADLVKAKKPENKLREQQIMAEIQTLQLEIKNATDATRAYAAQQMRGIR